MPHHFEITVQPMGADGDTPDREPLRFTVANHDDIMAIAARIASKKALPADAAAPFAVGLKLFTEVMLQHCKNPLFAELQPHIADFIRRLKAMPDASTGSGCGA